eukprot:6173739-Pleurochrysis_carterae.AAC.4
MLPPTPLALLHAVVGSASAFCSAGHICSKAERPFRHCASVGLYPHSGHLKLVKFRAVRHARRVMLKVMHNSSNVFSLLRSQSWRRRTAFLRTTA